MRLRTTGCGQVMRYKTRFGLMITIEKHSIKRY